MQIIRNLINALPRRADTQAAIDRELQQTHDARVEEAKAAALMEVRMNWMDPDPCGLGLDGIDLD